MDKDGSNLLHDTKVKTLRGAVRDNSLVQLMGNTNMDRKEKRNLLGDLTRGRPNLRFISEFDEISLYDKRFSKKRFIK
jgi:hypothetical protein